MILGRPLDISSNKGCVESLKIQHQNLDRVCTYYIKQSMERECQSLRKLLIPSKRKEKARKKDQYKQQKSSEIREQKLHVRFKNIQPLF